MIGDEKTDHSLSRLLKQSRLRAEEMGAHVADLQAARASVSVLLNRLDEAVRAEEAAAVGEASINLADLARYLEGAAIKRAALAQTCERLDLEIAAARQQLDEAFIEMKKLEHLIGISKRVAQRRRSRSELAAIDDVARFRKRL